MMPNSNDPPAGKRAVAREAARRFLAQGDPLGWFEHLYDTAAGDAGTIPWADLAPNPHLLAWLNRPGLFLDGRTALVVGCGLGDDAEELSRRGFAVAAFDLSPTAIHWARERFPESRVRYLVTDLFEAAESWNGAFDLVAEAYTLQVLPTELRARAIRAIAKFVAPGGRLVVVSRGREASDPPGNMPWPLLRGELSGFVEAGLTELSFEDFMDEEQPPVRRFRAVYERPV